MKSILMKTILLVDDSDFMRTMCKDILEKNGYEVIGDADNGEAGVEVFKRSAPDLVLMNITMPKMDGIAALRKIREHDPGARVLMLTAMGQAAMVAEALLAGARRFVVKPFNPDKLIEEVQFVLGEENPASTPFNRRVLETLQDAAEGNIQNGIGMGNNVLSQAQIDAIITLAEKENPAEAEISQLMHDLFMHPHDSPPAPNEPPVQKEGTPPSIPSAADIDKLLNALSSMQKESPAPSATNAEKILTALEKNTAGQEKMLVLLERIAGLLER